MRAIILCIECRANPTTGQRCVECNVAYRTQKLKEKYPAGYSPVHEDAEPISKTFRRKVEFITRMAGVQYEDVGA